MKSKRKVGLIFLVAVMFLLVFFAIRSTSYFIFQAKWLYEGNKTKIDEMVQIFKELDGQKRDLRIWRTYDGGIGIEADKDCCETFTSDEYEKLELKLDKLNLDKGKVDRLNELLNTTGLIDIHSWDDRTVIRIKTLFPNGQVSFIIGQDGLTDSCKPLDNEVCLWESAYY